MDIITNITGFLTFTPLKNKNRALYRLKNVDLITKTFTLKKM